MEKNEKNSKQKQSRWRQRKTPQTKRKGAALMERLYGNRLAMVVTSLVIAVILWFIISIAIYPTTLRTVYHVPVEVEITGTSAESSGLSVIDYDVEEVSVQLEGNRSQVGNVDADNLTATAVIEDVSSAGTKTLSIEVKSNDGTEFTVKSISPAQVDVTFDYIDTYTFDIQASAPNITFAEGCVLDEDNFVCTPGTIDVTGPQQELEQVSYCVVETDQKEQLSASKILTTDTLLFYNEDGTLVDDTNFSYDVARFSIEIPVLYQKTLDITYQITNVPSNFDLDCLNLELSASEIILAAPSSSIDEMVEFNIGSISLRDIDLDYSQDFVVSIPDEYSNLSGLSTVTLSLDSTGLTKKDFVLTDIGIINAPASYDFEILTQQITVSVIGPEDELEGLDASDITANIDLMSYTVQADAEDGDTVTFSYTPTISCSKYDDVWAVGNYSVYVQGVYQDAEESSSTDESSEE